LIPKETIEKIFETVRIEEVIGEFVNLKRSGQNYKGLSPFTDERNPSFYVSPAKNIFKCFSSGKGGNAVNFLMEHEHLTYPEALRYLAKKYNIEIEEREQTEEEKEAQSERETLYHVSAFAQKYFSEQLSSDETGRAIGLKYFQERGFNPETIELFQLGYSPDQWDAFTVHATGQGYKLEYLEKTGLSVVKDHKRYDRFRGRVIFPIHNLTGRILGFGARTLKSGDNIPKYLNSIDSEIYNKSRVLYGLYFAKGSIIKKDNCLLVEGYTDVISLYQAGFMNVVSSSGTSLTKDQIRLIQKYTSNITILYDGDPAGIKASFRSIDMILEEGMNVRIVLFPEGEDPDSFVRKHRHSEAEKLISEEATDFIRFKTGLLLDEAGTDPIQRASLIREIVTSISLIPDAITRSVYIKECSSMMEIAEQALMNELNKMLRKKLFKGKDTGREITDIADVSIKAEQPQQIDVTDPFYQEKYLVRLLLMYGDRDLIFDNEDQGKKQEKQKVNLAEFVIREISTDNIKFNNTIYQKIFDIFKRGIEAEEVVNEKVFLNHEDEEIASTAIHLSTSPYELSPNWEQRRIIVVTEEDKLKEAVIAALLSFKARTVEGQIQDLQQEIKECDDDENMMIHLSKLKELKEINMKINKELGGRVVTR